MGLSLFTVGTPSSSNDLTAAFNVVKGIIGILLEALYREDLDCITWVNVNKMVKRHSRLLVRALFPSSRALTGWFKLSTCSDETEAARTIKVELDRKGDEMS